MKPSISVILPVYNEAANMPRLNRHLRSLPGFKEFIFADGGSTDGTPQLAAPIFRVVACAQKGRGAQMNDGAAQARGDVLLFLHADSRLPQDAAAQIEAVMDRGFRAGCFKIRFDSKHPLMKLCALASDLRVVFRRIIFGDQGIFIERKLFEQLGGYRAIPLMEDYDLSIRLKQRGERPGMAKGRILTSARRFVQNGPLKTMWRMQVYQHLFRKGINPALLAHLYDEKDTVTRKRSV